jgi:tetratricopeptide (TPR) repeat protein
MRPLALFLLLATAAFAAVPQAELDAFRQLIADRKFAEAEAAATKLTKTYPQDGAAFVALGTAHMNKQDPEPAVKAFEKAVALDPKSSDYQRRLGDAYGFAAQKAGMMSKLGWARKCLAAYEKAVELDPKSIAARQSLMGFYQQAPGMVGGGMDKAYAQAAEIKKLDADRGRLAFAQLYAADKKWSEAFTEFEEVLKTEPTNYLALFQIGRMAAMSGERVDRGIETLKQALTLTPSAGAAGHDAAHWRLGMLLEKKGDKAGAKAAYEASLKLNPKFPQAIEALKKLNAA